MANFIGPKILKKIDRKVKQIRQVYPNGCQDWQLFDMVASVVAGVAEKTFFDGNGIVVDGWNGYRSYTEKNNPNPDSAWGGFYRTEKAQMLGTAIRYARHAQSNGGNAEEVFRNAADTYGFRDWYWEPVERIWGYRAIAQFYSEQEARDVEAQITKLTGYRRHTLELSEMSGMWRLIWETSRKPEQYDNYQMTHRTRINANGEEMA